jgi:selenocysteine-specific elongation factor
MTVVVGTAGHIDHGKTSLLRALTGIDADRLPEERARGMTVDVGYAHLDLSDGMSIDFVDVPGHDRLVGNMLVGAGEIDAALVVVAADDGPRAQTLEHLELLDALGVQFGLAVVTKTRLVTADRLAEVIQAVAALLERTTLAGSPVVAADALTGDGLHEVRGRVLELRDLAAAAAADAPSSTIGTRFAIDRVFAIRGRGTVVTGTLRGAPVSRGAALHVVPSPSGDEASVRVREVQVHNRQVEAGGPGRVALNVVPSDPGVELRRGLVLTDDPAAVASDRFLVALRPAVSWSAEAGALPGDRSRVAVHLGTAQTPGVLGRAGRDGTPLSGGEATAIVRTEIPIAVAPGDRLVLRRPSPGATLAAARVLDPLPPRGVARRRATPERLEALAAADAGSAAWRQARLESHGLLGSTLASDVARSLDDVLLDVAASPGSIGSAELVRAGAAALRRQVGHVSGLDRAAGDRIDALVQDGRLARRQGLVSLPGVAPDESSPELTAAMNRLVAGLTAPAPPSLAAAAAEAGCPEDGVRQLERDGRIVRVEEDLAWSAETWSELVATALVLSAREPLTPAALRDATGTSRKYVMALLEELDRRAILRRTPAGHVPGPRAALAATR